MFEITVNNKKYQVEEGLTIIEACDKLGIKIPRFCYHSNLSIPANCRMCLVDVKGGRKPVPACHTKISNEMDITTESENVHNVRKGVMEFLLINHPLDCPICDEAGQCELQNQAVAYGFNDTSYEFDKRARENKDLGPLISTYMVRCINCTRCIRFMDEIAGLPDLGIVGRGEHSDISNYFQQPIASEISGNLVDVCPVGALNNAQYLFRDRAWQLTSTNTIDIMDALGSSIVVDMEQEEVVRIRPLSNPDINEVWLSDKARYICDSVDVQRLDSPWIRENGKLKKVSFNEAFEFIKNNMVNLKGDSIAALAGKFADVESMVVLKELMKSFDSGLFDCRINNITFNPNNSSSYLFNSSLNGIEQADCILIVGSNPKIEAPLLNARIRKRSLNGNLTVGVIGKDINLNYEHINLGSNVNLLLDILNEKNDFSKILKNAKNPMIIVGEGAFINQDSNKLLSLLNEICNKFNVVNENWNGYNFIHTSIAAIGGMQVGFVPNDYQISVNNILDKVAKNDVRVLWLLDFDELDFSKTSNAFVIYQGHHGDKAAEHANVILPGQIWLEKKSTYVNLEGRVLQTNVAKKSIGNAKEDWKIIKAFSDYIGKNLPFNNISDVRAKILAINPEFANLNNIIPSNRTIIDKAFSTDIASFEVTSSIKDYYLTDIFSRNSSTLAKCSKLFNQNNNHEKL
ncbi:NADH-quinone oxidoreductase subunit NuoG [Rickettsiales bacterium LUAb2]